MMNNNRALRLHERAALFLMVFLREEATIIYQKNEYKRFLNANQLDSIRLFNTDSDFTDVIEKMESLKIRVMEKYKNVMLKLYSPDLAKTETLWQTLAATKLLLEHKAVIAPDFIEEIKKVLNDNRP